MCPLPPVSAYKTTIVIPTYPIAKPDPNPMFLEHRFNQGASGKVYPNPLVDHVPAGPKSDRPYQAVFLENEYLQLILLPELGGRIFAALDKTNQYNFFYRQHVIKPALIGLFGNWISGGVEFNWPLHHRPSTFMPTDYVIKDHPDGSKTVWMSEHDPLERMKGMVGISLYPGRAVIETKVRLYNRTPFPKSFLWWHNAAVHVNDDYQVFFPPDVTYVTYHGRRDYAYFPVVCGSYVGTDYDAGVDFSWHKNIKEAISYFAAVSRYDFFGGYDHGRQAGVIHVADHHISPGKKLFSWGNSEFEHSWRSKLTDSDGPYAELMAGVYTDNQPDFSWLQPYETKVFSQFWYPIQKIGSAKNANSCLAVNLETLDRQIKVGIYAVEEIRDAHVSLLAGDRVVINKNVTLAPGRAFLTEASLPLGSVETDLLFQVSSAEGQELIRYSPEERLPPPTLPPPASEPASPANIKTNEELYLTGLHLDQYRNPLFDPEDYWREALQRDPEDARNNNALGRLLLRRGAFTEAEKHFRRAIKTLTIWNQNPLDGEPFYNLGLTLRYQQRFTEAYTAFYKAIWSYAWQAAGYYALAEIDCRRGDFAAALDHLERSFSTNTNSLKTRDLKAAVLRHLGRFKEARSLALQTAALDLLDYWASNELVLVTRAERKDAPAQRLEKALSLHMRADPQIYLDIAFDYTNAGLWEEACDLLSRLVTQVPSTRSVYPMALYTLGYCLDKTGKRKEAGGIYRQAAKAIPLYCFPARLEEWEVLQHVIRTHPRDGHAAYYLGNLLYDKHHYDQAIELWNKTSQLVPDFPIAWRNLSLASFNIWRDLEKARDYLLKALALDSDNARLFYEYDLLLKQSGVPPADRLARLEQRLDLVEQRDALYLERVALYNQMDQPQKALDLLLSHRFNPWEGGEAAVGFQYTMAHLLLGILSLRNGWIEEACVHFEAASAYPENLGAGKWLPVMDVPARYWIGVTREKLGQKQIAQAFYREIAAIKPDFWHLELLPDLSYYRGKALQHLGDEEGAHCEFHALLDTAMRMESANAYATSVPNFLVFEDDPHKLIQIEIDYLRALAWLGLGQKKQARKMLEETLRLDSSHLNAKFVLQALSTKGLS